MSGRDFAIYTGAASWTEEIDALTLLLDVFSHSYELVNAVQINRGILMDGGNRRFRALIMPGGNVFPRCVQLIQPGKASIRHFVAEGGGYLGFCAGAYFAATTVVNAERASGNGGKYNQPSDYNIFHHDLALFDGIATGPVGWAPFTHFGMDFEETAVNRGNPIMAAIGMPDRIRLFGQGGPFFTPRLRPQSYRVWARAIAPAHSPKDAITGDGKPTIVSYRYGRGPVVLSSYHPGTTSRFTSDEERYHSLNLLHAFLKVTIEEAVTPLAHDAPKTAAAQAVGKIPLA